MKPEQDAPFCPDCGERVHNHQEASITPIGVFHAGCDLPSEDEI